jgi:transcription-repair coupling factor (superfamily II helicase)
VLIEIARLRVEALRVGVALIVAMRREVRLAPVQLTASQEVRLQRIAPKAVLRDRGMFVPLSPEAPATRLADFIRTMWPPDDG